MKKSFSLLLILFTMTFFIFMPTKSYAADESNWAKLGKVMNLSSTEGVDGVFEVVANGDTREIKLYQDITATSVDRYLHVNNQAIIYLDMNEHTLDRGLANEDPVVAGYLFRVNGWLEISGGGTLCGGNNADTDGGGGAILNWGVLSISDGTTICDNKALCGGAIYNKGLNTSSKVTVTNSTIKDNEATGTSEVGGKGGAIYNAGKGTLTVTESTISGNYAKGSDEAYSKVCGEGGAIYNDGTEKVTVTGSTISDNYVTGYYGCGGAIFNNGTLVIEGNTTINNNKASEDGGAIYNKGELTVRGSTLNSNTSDYNGGAIYNNGKAEATTSVFDHNTCRNKGGTIFNGSIDGVNLIDCKITNSSAPDGGAIYADRLVQFTGSGSSQGSGIIDSCTATCGGAVEISQFGRFEMSGGAITNCSANEGGGGIYSKGAIELEGMTISNNHANGESNGHGGGIYLGENGSISLGTNTKIIDNTLIDCANNLYLDDNLLMVKFGTGEDVKAPSSGMQIGVTKKNEPVVKNPVDLQIAGAKASYKDYIFSDNSSYEVKFKNDTLILAMRHTHDFEFSSEDNRVVAKCKGECEDFYDENPLTLTWSPQSALVYDGKEKAFSFADSEIQTWSKAGLDVSEINYYKKSASGESYDKIDSAPVDAGIYQAGIDIESKTARYDFEIQKKEITVMITPNGGEYKKTITPATAVFEGLVNGDDIKPVLTYTSKNYDSTEVPTEAGTYTVTASLPKETSNYELTGKVTAEFVISGGVTPTPTPTVKPIDPTKRFHDVPAGKWYSKPDGPIVYVVANKIMNGTGDGTTFEPESPCTREMFVQILYNAEGAPGAGPSNPFTDVMAGKWYYKAVTWALANNVTSGKTATLFGVGESVTREQLAQFLMNYAKKCGYDTKDRADLSKFPDVAEISGWAKNAISWTNANGIINGKAKNGKNYLDPKGNATRAETAQMIMAFQKKFMK